MVELDQQDLVLLRKDTPWPGEPGRNVPLRVKLTMLASGLALLSAALMLAVAATGAILSTLGRPLAPVEEAGGWLRSDYRLAVLAIALSGLGFALAWLARRQFLTDQSLWADAGCPSCAEHDFMRVRRKRVDRLIYLFRVPVRRYTCRNCHWDGLRRYGGPIEPNRGGAAPEPATLEWEGQKA